MSDTKHVVVTREGLQRMKEELEYKETTEKMKVAEQLKVAISYGDLSENAEYDAAKNEEALNESEIRELENKIKNAKIMEESTEFIKRFTSGELKERPMVGCGSRVTIVYEDDPDEEETYTIVGTSESDPTNGKLSNESPVGAALVGAHVGETVVAQTPGGALRIKVIEIAL